MPQIYLSTKNYVDVVRLGLDPGEFVDAAVRERLNAFIRSRTVSGGEAKRQFEERRAVSPNPIGRPAARTR